MPPDSDLKTEAEFTESDWIQRARDPYFRPKKLAADEPEPETDPAKKSTAQFLDELQKERQ
jgi:hypothetical protein